ncbi:MAG: NAD-dependent epimerase/dehydratase family protein [Candidatus Woesearchaeota archaeon]
MEKVVVTGAAGLVGQNLMFELGKYDVLAVDKHEHNLAILKKYHPEVKTLCVDLSSYGEWEKGFKADYLIILHAHIVDRYSDAFVRDNITATKNVLRAAKKHGIKYIVHLSSSVVISTAKDDYTKTKRKQEELVRRCGIAYTIFRPPLMFGWFDKKHLGWLSRFMAKTPVYPVPGDGKYIRQPLFVGDMCRIILRTIEMKPENKVFNIIGKEKIPYIELMRKIKGIKRLRTIIMPLPIWLFELLMRVYGLFFCPPFTPDQLRALVAGDVFPDWDWEKYFNVSHTPIDKAYAITFKGEYAEVVCAP